MSDNIREEIEAFKRTNGNLSFNQRDMTIYIVSKMDKNHIDVLRKIDDIQNMYIQRMNHCSNLFTTKMTFWKVLGLLVTVFTAILGSLAWLIFNN